ncbi:hypothetical protein DBR45_60050 [Pseudomonas sp. HMWF031]|jgi:hypothetical protein|nr:hypothetical protein DBR45_60050 [Pseudomonas sp. HMWF031]
MAANNNDGEPFMDGLLGVFFGSVPTGTTALMGCGWMAFWRQLYHGALQSSRYDHVPVKI